MHCWIGIQKWRSRRPIDCQDDVTTTETNVNATKPTDINSTATLNNYIAQTTTDYPPL